MTSTYWLAAESPHPVSEPVFHIGSLPVSPAITALWTIMAFLTLFAWLATRQLKRVPETRLQVLVEMLVEGQIALMSQIMDEDRARRYVFLPGTLFLLILVANYSGLLPVIPTLPWYTPPTSHWGVTIGLALVVFVFVQYSAIVTGRGAHFRAWFQPWGLAWLRIPLGIIEELVRPFSLSIRLFANVFAGEAVLILVLGAIPYLLPVGVMGLELITGGIQALIFALLTTVYLAEVTATGHH